MKRGRRQAIIDAVDLFCGAGGLSYGLSKSGIDIRAGIDIDPACNWPFRKNLDSTFLLKDVAEVSGKSLKKYFRKRSVKVLAGCAPCQRFSNYTQKESRLNRNRWQLLDSFTFKSRKTALWSKTTATE
jgi:DNA (cytosine-5)-methyltransferase 1